MTQALDAVRSFIVGLFDLIMSAIDAIEAAIRQGLTQVGVSGSLQTAVLLAVLILLIVAALQLFGRVFAALITVFLLLLVIHALMPSALHTAHL